VNTTKAHIAALSLLDRALIAVTDDELVALMAGLPEDHVSAIKRISAVRDAEAPGDEAPGAEVPGAEVPGPEVIAAIREAAHKGRLNGDLQRLGVVLSDACLADCVEQLGDAADMPTEDDLQKVMPALIDKHGVGVVRLMLASTVVGEAPASAIIIGMLKNDEAVALPPAADKPLAPLLPLPQDDAGRLALKAQRKERKAQEQAAAKLRRDQVARAKNRI
jgi:hypothetical protein